MDVDADQHATPAERTGLGSGPVVGATLLVAAAVSAYVLRVGGVCCGGIVARDLYDYGTWLLVAGLAVVGVILVAARVRVVRVPAAAAGGVLAAQLAGTGVVAFRRWVPVGGFGHGKWDNIRPAAAGRVPCSPSAASAPSWSASSRSAPRRRSPSGPWTAARVALSAGLLVVVALPVVFAGGQADILDVTSIGAHALVYSVPFGVSLALTGWLSRPAAVAVSLCVDGQRARAGRREPAAGLDDPGTPADWSSSSSRRPSCSSLGPPHATPSG